MNLKNFKKLSGDASFRSFYRKKNYKKSTILVFCKKQKKSNLAIYDAINNLLIKENLSAPKMINNNYHKNYIEIQDLGNLTVLQLLKKSKEKKIFYYKKIISLLKKIQKIKKRRIKTFKNTEYKIPNYSSKKLLDEANLFLQWYLPKFIKGNRRNVEKRKISKIFKNLLNRLIYKKNVFIHRDFHISNIMITKQGLGIIDSQDAVFGNITYDLASLIDDVRFKTDKKFKDKILNHFFKNNKSLDRNKFQNDFEILSVLRNFKIIGIFSRLSKRDQKHKYLKLIPYAWKLIEYRINNNTKFKDLKNIMDKNFPKKIRKK